MITTTTILAAVVGAIWLLLASVYMRQAAWLLLLWIPIQGWFQLNVFNDSNLAVLIYEFQMLGLYVVFGLRALKFPGAFGPPAMMRFAIPFAVWALLLVPYSVSQAGLLLTLVGLRTFLLPLPLVWIGYRAFDTREQLDNVTTLLALQLLLIGGLTLSQLAGVTSMRGAVFEVPTGFIATNYVLRPPGTFAHPGHLGHYVLFSIPFAIGLLGLNVSFWKRLAFAVGLAGATIALIANTQRAAIVLLAVALPLTALLARRGRIAMRIAIAFGVMAAVGALIAEVAGEVFLRRVATISDDFNRTLTTPADDLSDALRTPVLGGGLGVASPGVGRLTPTPAMNAAALRPLSIKFGESFVAALVYETGVPGLVLCFLFVGATMYYTLQALRRCRGSDMELLAAALFSVQVVMLLFSWTYSPLRTPPIRVLFWFWAGVLLSLPRLATAKAVIDASGSPLRPPAQRLAAAMGQRMRRSEAAHRRID